MKSYDQIKFRQMKQNFHVMDNATLQKGDKLGKIRPIYEELNKKFQQFGVFHSKLSIDESMVPYYGHYSCKLFINGSQFVLAINYRCFVHQMEIHTTLKFMVVKVQKQMRDLLGHELFTIF